MRWSQKSRTSLGTDDCNVILKKALKTLRDEAAGHAEG